MTSERRNITQPADWWVAFCVNAEVEGLTLSEWVGKCCLAAIPASDRKRLSERPSVGKPKQTAE